MLAHNKLTMNTDFDFDLLSEEITELSETLDLTDFGFNEREILELTIDDSPDEFRVETSHVFHDGENAISQYENSEYGESSSMTQNTYGGITREELNQYSSRAEQMVTKRVIIVYSSDEEENYLKEILSQDKDKPLGVVFDIKKIMEKQVTGGGPIREEENDKENAD